MEDPSFQDASTIISYNIALDHSSDTEIIFVLESIESTSRLFLSSVLRETNYLIEGLRGEGVVELGDIRCLIDSSTKDKTREYRIKCRPLLIDMSFSHLGNYISNNQENSCPLNVTACDPSTKDNICTFIDIDVNVTYPRSITMRDVRFEFLQYAEPMASMISNGLMKAKYVGPVPIDTLTKLSLSGSNLTILEQNDYVYFENVVEVFLKDMFLLSSLRVHDVRVDRQQLVTKTILQNDKETTPRLEISTTIVGEYTPPPILDLAYFIDEVFEESDQYFVEGIKGNRIFASLNGIEAKSSTKQYMPLSTAKTNTKVNRNNIFYVQEFSIPLYFIITILVLFGILYLLKKYAKKTQEQVKMVGMQEIMEQREISIGSYRDVYMNRGNSSKSLFSKDSKASAAKSIVLKSEERVYSIRNLQVDDDDTYSRASTIGSRYNDDNHSRASSARTGFSK